MDDVDKLGTVAEFVDLEYRNEFRDIWMQRWSLTCSGSLRIEISGWIWRSIEEIQQRNFWYRAKECGK